MDEFQENHSKETWITGEKKLFEVFNLLLTNCNFILIPRHFWKSSRNCFTTFSICFCDDDHEWSFEALRLVLSCAFIISFIFFFWSIPNPLNDTWSLKSSTMWRSYLNMQFSFRNNLTHTRFELTWVNLCIQPTMTNATIIPIILVGSTRFLCTCVPLRTVGVPISVLFMISNGLTLKNTIHWVILISWVDLRLKYGNFTVL